MYNKHWGMFIQPLLQWKTNKYCIIWVCICSFRYPVCNVHAPYYHLWPTQLYNILPHYLKQHDFWKKLLNTKYVFWYSLQLCLKRFLFWEELSEIWSKMYICRHVNYPLFSLYFIDTWIILTNFWKIFKYHIYWKSVQWELSCCMLTDGNRLDAATGHFLLFC